MITATPPPRHPTPGSAGMPLWQREMASAITSVEALALAVGLEVVVPPSSTPLAAAAFKLRVPASYVRRMRRGDPRDPLLLQVLPTDQESEDTPEFTADPVGERAALRAPGLLQKYSGRALLITTQACAVHCRYCFRREFPYAEQISVDGGRWSEALAEIARDASIEEVILSGGDPLTLGDARLQQITDALGA